MKPVPQSLRLGVPSKGRLAEVAAELLKDAGLSFRRQERSLFARVREMGADVTFLRPEDMPVLCAEGAIDMGITGSDLVAESGADVVERLALGIGQCRLAICVPEESRVREPGELHRLRVATSFPNSTRSFLASHGAEAHLVELSGSVEVMIALGVADAIVDLVETGSTLAANRLRVLTDIGSHQAVLIQNRRLRDAELADRIVRRIEGVVIARAYALLEYNVPRARLGEAEKITPGFKSPTVSALEDPEWCAVKVMVKRAEVIAIMEKLEALGASAILQTEISNCRL
jgi:ATP phosphoribosyltransferase